MSLEKLIKVLQAIELDDSIEVKEYLTDGGEGDLPLLVEQAVELAEHELITPRGGCCYVGHRVLEGHGFRVFAGEKDSFGWLTGCIRTSKGIIVYG